MSGWLDGRMKRQRATHGTDIFARVGSTLCNFIPTSDTGLKYFPPLVLSVKVLCRNNITARYIY